MRKLLNYPKFEAFLKAKGFNPADAKTWVRKWRQVKLKRYVGFAVELSLRQYMMKAKQAGVLNPAQIGNKAHQYNLARYGDSGGYTENNCRFITAAQNAHERSLNGGALRGGNKIRGRTKANNASVASMASILAERNKENHPPIAAKAERQARRYRIVSPEGDVYVGKNLKEFCLEHNLRADAMSRTLRGIYATTAGGWHGRYLP